METNNRTQKEKQRRFLLAVPLLVLPFAALAFHALGGGKGTPQPIDATSKGINTTLPGANFRKETPRTKLDLYEQAKADSMKRIRDEQSRRAVAESLSEGFTDPQEEQVMQKLAMLEDELYRPVETPEQAPQQTRAIPITASGTISAQMPDTQQDIERLEKMMERLNSSDPAEDPEMEQLNGMLERILDIQHPERVQDKLREQSLANRESVYPVTLAGDSLPDNAIRAAIHRDQEVINGSSIQIRLLDSVYINGRLIPANSFAYGICAISGERLTISVRTIRHGNSILPVSLTAYDLDGIPGLKASTALTRDAVTDGSNNAIQGMQLMSFDPSLAAQAATAGVNAAKGLFNRRVRQAKVNTKAGYDLLLRDDNQR
ncbi:conjugative transposon protein TraM [Parapedobacter koreensis]|uniref:Bacteroides conjugative transposon TraM protein n=1 Tax=Parapedobacter koreensis TaxID=332977 RepID=A0A1H7FBP3_9SPHI|nr:conjugative transposon protein TraM [Parapedobacter koreensis]SEK23479.1 Bacteroides conjugative transposon TraM protein [Parapedobacter koreensis]